MRKFKLIYVIGIISFMFILVGCAVSDSNNSNNQIINKTDKLSTPVIDKIEYDIVYWNSVPNAEYYTVTANDNYELTLKGTSCEINKLLWNGSSIEKHGYVRVTVQAVGYDKYESSDISKVYDSYYYVPETNGGNVSTAISYSIGYGYNLIEDDYLDITKAKSLKSIFNIGKLLNVGEYTVRNHSGGEGKTYNYSTIDEFLSKTQINVEYQSEKGCVLLGSVKKQINVDFGFEYSKYDYNNTYVFEYDWTYKDHMITNFSNFDVLEHCLSKDFIEDVKGRSFATQGMSLEERAKYIYNTYGTHAILGVTTGGTYRALYTISTNKENIAGDIKIEFERTPSENGAIDKVIKNDFGVGIDIEQELSWKSDETEARFTTEIYGGSGGGSTSAGGVESAISKWTSSFTEDNARSIKFTENGAISISTLISFIDNGLASKYNDYLDQVSDETYKELYSEYTKPTTLPMTVSTIDGENVLKIDLSSFQSSGSIDNAYSSNLLNNQLVIYPIMFGKRIDKIHVYSSFNDADSRKLIDNLSIQLSAEWNRDVKVLIENLGVKTNSNYGFIDYSKVKKLINVDIEFNGTNIIQNTDGTYELMANINNEKYNYLVTLGDEESLDCSTYEIIGGELYLPIVDKVGNSFKGWYDANNIHISDSFGKVLSGVSEELKPITAKFGPNIYRISLNASDATSMGIKEIFVTYTVGYSSDREGLNLIESIENLPLRTGYTFAGYYKDDIMCVDELGKIISTSMDFIENTQLVAKWIPNVYKINLDSINAENKGTELIYQTYKTGIFSDNNSENILSKIDLPKKDGFVFGGYYESVTDNGTSFALGNKLVINADGTIVEGLVYDYLSDITLYALWTKDKYYITYNTFIQDDAENVVPCYNIQNNNVQTYSYLNNGTLSFNTPLRTQYDEFLGWYTEPEFINRVDGDNFDVWFENWKTAPSNITLYAKWKLAIYYDTLAETPWLNILNHGDVIRDVIVVDWSQSDNVDYTAAVDPDGNGYRDDNYTNLNININNPVKEVYFIGNKQLTYKNVHLYPAGYAEGSQLTINLNNFNYISNSSALDCWFGTSSEDVGMYLTINIEGICSIRALDGNNAINNFRNILITGNGEMSIYGGNGLNGSNPGSNGNEGCAAMNNIGTLTVDMNGVLNIYGGNGGNGATGVAGTTVPGLAGLSSSGDGLTGANGGNGGTGGTGGNGGKAVIADCINAITVINCYSGNGGNGGTGGDGGDGQSGSKGKRNTKSWWEINMEGEDGEGGDGGHGGHGGNGGDGGAKGVSSATSVTANTINGTINQIKQNDGLTGNGGNGGHGGNGGDGGDSDQGRIGDTGDGGHGGKGGIGYIGGAGGNGGNGGDKGKGENAHNYGEPGAGGAGGQGEIQNGSGGSYGTWGRDYQG